MAYYQRRKRTRFWTNDELGNRTHKLRSIRKLYCMNMNVP